MTILETLRTDLTNARKGGRKWKWEVGILSFVIGEITGKLKNKDAIGKPEDEIVLAYLKKQVASLRESHEFKVSRGIDSDDEAQAIFLTAYLPVELSAEEIEAIINENTFTNVGEFMKFMKEHYNGQYDGKLASQMWKNLNG